MKSIKLVLPFSIPPKSTLNAISERNLRLYIGEQMREKHLTRLEGNLVVSANIYYKREKPGELSEILTTLLEGIKKLAIKDNAQVIGFERVYLLEDSGQDCVVLEIRQTKNL